MKLIAHRSGPVTYPEQTIASAREALSLGADMVELDVRYTADRRIAVSHDQNVNRVFGQDRLVGEMTGTEFLALRHASDPSFGSHLFEDYLRCGVAPLLIHVKEKEVIGDLLDLLCRYGYEDKAVLGVAEVESVAQIRGRSEKVRILSFGKSVEDISRFIDAGVDYVRLWESWLTPERVRLVRESPAQLWVMSGNTGGFPVGEPGEENLRAILSYDPDGLLINDVRLAQKALS